MVDQESVERGEMRKILRWAAIAILGIGIACCHALFRTEKVKFFRKVEGNYIKARCQ